MIMKSKRNLLEQLKSLPHFSKDSVHHLGRQLGLTDATLDTYISRFLKYKEIIPLKKGTYVSADFLDKNRKNISYSFYLANIIREPSYVSSWSALQFYNLATEAIYGITSVTPKLTRKFSTKAGNFSYQSIKKDLFSDFTLISDHSSGTDPVQFDFFIASPSKALFDLLYFMTRQFRGIRMKDIALLVEDLRIDIEEMDKKEKSKFYLMVEGCMNNE